MSALPARPERHLHVVDHLVDQRTGETFTAPQVEELLARVDKLETDLHMAQRDVKRKNRQIAELERNKAQERLDHPDRDLIVRVATYWHKRCKDGDPRVDPLSPARFDAVAGLAEMTELRMVEVDGKKRRRKVKRYDPAAFKEAIDGAHFDHFRKQRKNGSWQAFDDLELIMRDAKQFEEFRARAPKREGGS